MNLTYTFANKLFSKERIKELNEQINKNLIKSNDSPASDAVKTSTVKFLKYNSIEKLIKPFVEFSYQSNEKIFGFDLFPLGPDKILNYNIYEEGTEYNWHFDGTEALDKKDIKLTCLLNCSEESCTGGDLSLFVNGEMKCKELDIPGTAIVFPSFINHKVSKLTSGSRKTLAIWMYGKKFR